MTKRKANMIESNIRSETDAAAKSLLASISIEIEHLSAVIKKPAGVAASTWLAANERREKLRSLYAALISAGIRLDPGWRPARMIERAS